MEITEQEYNSLKECHKMLGIISCYVEDFCDEEDTTLMGVIRLLAQYHRDKSDLLYRRLDELKEELD
jgi:hypothetical protein